MNIRRKERRERAVERLENQLKAGTKPSKEENVIALIPLTDSDIKRIKQELKTLSKV